ncbi:MAG: thioredoxin domain-containing protein, partial [Thiobacillus sp.]|nr:thioredoxin domain-containing protein [Thiobacillus sp.]
MIIGKAAPLWLALLVLLLNVGLADAAPLRNRLAGHPSPYLALHGHDPVAWQEWNAETLARAKRENKLLFVSVGYFACHWCHVMQRESYSDPAIAALLNRYFIPVKVDRELNGALDTALIDFAKRMNGVAGWPLNAFVTPDGYPTFAILYQPPGQFRMALESLAEHWRRDSAKTRDLARRVAMRPVPAPAVAKPDAKAVAAATTAFLDASLRMADTLQGGFGHDRKFSRAPQLALLLKLQAERPDRELAEFLRLTLDRMAGLGLHDPVNGGFFRYTVDPDWATPHFEKMLYDNAQLALVYRRAAATFAAPAYGDIARDTLDFMLATLATPSGGLQTSVSALDALGREGGAYLWQAAELRQRLAPDEYALVRRLWGLDSAPAFELGYLPMEPGTLTAPERVRLKAVYGKLRAAGRAAGLPRDGKLNAGLNGLALSAFSLAGKGVPRFERAAHRLYRFIAGRLVADGRLAKALAGGRRFPDAELDDYAYVVRGLLDYGRAFGDADARDLAGVLARRAWQAFFTDRGWRREARPLLATARPEAALP